jgi:hypothetical protein
MIEMLIIKSIGALNSLKVEKVSFINDKESARFEYVKLNVVNYMEARWKKIFFVVNA